MTLTYTRQFEIENKDGSKETRTSTLVEYADPKGQLSSILQGNMSRIVLMVSQATRQWPSSSGCRVPLPC